MSELILEPKRFDRNKVTGQFLPGMTPHNKGKKWDDFLSKEQQKKILNNLRPYMGRGRKDIGGWNAKPVIATDDEGNFLGWFSSSYDAEAKTGIKSRYIRYVIEGRQKHAGGFRWERA